MSKLYVIIFIQIIPYKKKKKKKTNLHTNYSRHMTWIMPGWNVATNSVGIKT